MSYFMKVQFPATWEKEQKEYTWHINDEKPPLPDEALIILFQADGDELELIMARMPNVPYAYSFTRWRSILARFVYDNLTKS